MPLDGIFLTALKDELKEKLIGARVDKVRQPERDQIILSVRKAGDGTSNILISAGNGDARIHLTEKKFDNPQTPPMFCMLLRKHLTGAKILDVSQPNQERVLDITVEASSSLGDKTKMRLIVELIGAMSNIILVDNEGRIVECVRRAGNVLDGKRALQPGLFYKNPPSQPGKVSPFDKVNTSKETSINNEVGLADKWLLSRFNGISPLIAREITWRAFNDTSFAIKGSVENINLLLSKLNELIEAKPEPWLIMDNENNPVDFSYTKIGQYESLYEPRKFENFSSLIDFYFTRSSQDQRMRQKSATTLKSVKTLRDRVFRKINMQSDEFLNTSKRDKYREAGDLITANMYAMKKGQKLLIADDFYSENGGKREIVLDQLKTPQQNAARYYKLYTKAKNAAIFLQEQIENGKKDLDYFESVIELLGRVNTEQELNEVKTELSNLGYIKISQKSKVKQKESAPMEFRSSSGFRIYAGRNNTQNDKLTHKLSARTDLWFHTQKIHGSHIIVSLEGRQIDDTTLKEAASIAAFYSAARTGHNVPVDYTLIKYVKKPSGSRPGYVIYTEQKTIIVNPDENLVGRLQV